jgi:hypothetical protein
MSERVVDGVVKETIGAFLAWHYQTIGSQVSD